MRTNFSIRRAALRVAASTTIAVIAAAGVTSAAQAATTASSSGVQPQTKVCQSGGGWVYTYKSTTLAVANSYTDYNGTGSNETVAFNNTSSSTKSSTKSANVSVDLSDIIESVNAQFGYSTTSSETSGTGQTVTMTLPSHQYGHGNFGAWTKNIGVQYINETTACTSVVVSSGAAALVDGWGWNTYASTTG